MPTRKQKRSLRRRGGTHKANRNLRAVVTYERANPPRYSYIVPGNTIPIESRIATFLRSQPPVEQEEIVWRGQFSFPMNADSWVSTSKKDTIARSYGGRYLYKIHLMPGVHRVDMYNYYAKHGIQDPRLEPHFKEWDLNMSNNYTGFEEVLLGSGGTFWKDPQQAEEGFQLIGTVPAMSYNGKEMEQRMKVYETYYFMD
jgi:hypothetical protein